MRDIFFCMIFSMVIFIVGISFGLSYRSIDMVSKGAIIKALQVDIPKQVFFYGEQEIKGRKDETEFYSVKQIDRMLEKIRNILND